MLFRRSRHARWPQRRDTPSLEVLGARCLLASDPLMPLATTSQLSDVFFVGDGTDPAPPVKTITIRNNTDATIFPILRDANTGNKGGIFYDPKDPHNQEFRGYVGYVSGSGTYLGLPAHTTISVNVPLVFWDGANIYFATDGRDLIPASTSAPNPFEYNPNSVRYVAPAASDGAGRVLWYTVKNDLAHTPTPDAPAQLTEFTIRDPYLARFNVPPDQLIQLINYDVSYVDSNLLSVAMEATAVPIPNTTVNADYGWIGSTLDQGKLQSEIQNFVQNAGNELGQYFGGHGWPVYYVPAPAPGGLKIPSGANLFANSPLNDTRSKYDNLLYALSSGGPGPIDVLGTGSVLDNAHKNIIHLTFLTNADRDAFFAVLINGKKNGQVFQARTTLNPDVILGTVSGWTPSPTDATGTVTLDHDINLDPSLVRTFDLFRPATDYAATRIRDLWYAWAKYYVDTFTGTQQTLAGTIGSSTSNLLRLGADSLGKVALGMAVTGAGVRPGTTVLAFDPKDATKVYLSQLPSDSGSGSYTFNPPTPMLHAEEAQPLNLTFAPGADTENARKFAASVYEAMAAEGAIPIPVPPDTTPPKLPKSMVLVSTAIGCDILHLPNHDDALGGQVRDLVKSILRGVDNFNIVGESRWYPDPSLPTGGQTYNVFNLNPYVWFVHEKLGLSGYGFSVDDDTADVGANGTSTMDIVVSGNTGLKNSFEWFPSLAWGQITTQAQVISQGNGLALLQLNDPVEYQQIRPDDPANGVTGAYVWGAGIPAGTNLHSFGLLNRLQFYLSTNLAQSSKGQLIQVIFTGKNLAPTGLVVVPRANRLVTAADRFESRASAATTVGRLLQIEASYVQAAAAAVDTVLQSPRFSRTVRGQVRQFARLTAALHGDIRQALRHRGGSLSALKTRIQRYEQAVEAL